jgi:hypothetical protein
MRSRPVCQSSFVLGRRGQGRGRRSLRRRQTLEKRSITLRDSKFFGRDIDDRSRTVSRAVPAPVRILRRAAASGWQPIRPRARLLREVRPQDGSEPSQRRRKLSLGSSVSSCARVQLSLPAEDAGVARFSASGAGRASSAPGASPPGDPDSGAVAAFGDGEATFSPVRDATGAVLASASDCSVSANER